MKNILFPLLIFLCLNSCNSRLTKSSNVNQKGVSSISSNAVTDQVTSGVWGSISKAQRNILRGGLSGAAAGLVQVVTLMWLHTIINYQYRFGKPLLASIRELYAQGGFVRYEEPFLWPNFYTISKISSQISHKLSGSTLVLNTPSSKARSHVLVLWLRTTLDAISSKMYLSLHSSGLFSHQFGGLYLCL